MDPRPGHRENDQTTPACRTECTESRRLERKMLWESGSKRKKRFRYATIKLMKRNENVDVAMVCSADFGLLSDKTCFESGRFCCKKKREKIHQNKNQHQQQKNSVSKSYVFPASSLDWNISMPKSRDSVHKGRRHRRKKNFPNIQ